ncbi:MAG: LysR family transcriptional regulator [Pseudomonadota bacterium]
MIEDFRSLAVFHVVAEIGSFSGAARQLKLSTSVVSHHISKLEAKLGVSLFFRSTRSLSLTPEGQLIRDAARRMVHAGGEAIDALTEHSDQPVGALRVTMPAFGGNSPVYQRVWDFARDHPMVAITLNGSDKAVDLVKEGFDLAIRLGTLSDSSLMSRKIGTFDRVLAASPAYLARRGTVQTLDDLKTCEFVAYAMLPGSFDLVRRSERVRFAPENFRLEVDSIAAGKSAVLAGLGVLHLPVSEIEADLADGTLVEVLPAWRLPLLGIYAVWPDIGPQKKLTRLLIDYLLDRPRA